MAKEERRTARDLSTVPAFLRRPPAARPRPGGGRSSRPPDRLAAAQGRPAGMPARAAAPGAEDGVARPEPAPLPRPISSRRLAFVAGGLVVAWVVLAFGRQVGDAAAASDQAAQLRLANAQLTAEMAAVQADLTRVDDPSYIDVAARGYGLGVRHEVPFALAPDAPSLPPDAPGSASQRVGARSGPDSPFEAWLDLLFGPGG